MAVIDISEKLGKEPITIKLAEEQIYEVDCSAEKYMEVQQKLVNGEFSIQAMYTMIEELLGETALKYVKNQQYTVKQLEILVTAISAAVSEVSYEEMEKRFQNKQ